MTRRIFSLFLLIAPLLAFLSMSFSQEPQGQVLVITVDSVINPVSAEFIEKRRKQGLPLSSSSWTPLEASTRL